MLQYQHSELTKILFLAGSSQNTDANERKNIYLERIAAHNLPVTPQMITQGDYSEFVDRQVQHLLDNNPDAQTHCICK